MGVFDKGFIGGLSIKNRFVRSATWEGMASEEGEVTPSLVELMRRVAEGGAGLIIASHSYVQKVGQAGLGQVGIHKDEMIPGLAKMTTAVHQAGGTVFAQLAHAGTHAAYRLSGLQSLAPTAMFHERGGQSVEMTKGQIDEMIDAFGTAARRAKEAGFDGVQIHAAHGYCLSQFLSPWYNRRNDEYNGSVENRAKPLVRAYLAVREAVGAEMPVAVKINAEDFIAEGGFTQEMMLQTAQILQREGLDAVEMSGASITDKSSFSSDRLIDPKTPEDEGYYLDAARRYKAVLEIPLILVGGIRSLEASQKIIVGKTADFIAFSRPLVCEPDLIRRWQGGDTRRSFCISCSKCRGPINAGEGIRCIIR